MNKKEKMPIINKAIRKIEKSAKLRSEAENLKDEAQDELNKLARKACPFKKGQVFRKAGSNLCVKVVKVIGVSLRYGRKPGKDYWKAPFVLECKTCSVKGIIKTNFKWEWIDGVDVDKKWIDCS